MAANVDRHRRHQEEGHPELGLSDGARDSLDVHWMNREERGNQPGRASRQHERREPEDRDRHRPVQQDVRRVKDRCVAAADHPLRGEGKHRERTVAVTAVGARPVRVCEERPPVVQGVNLAVALYELDVVVGEVVMNANTRREADEQQ
jgi:hypothetical protein